MEMAQETFTIHDTRMYAASLIKLFAMEYSYQNMDALVANDSTYSGSEAASREKIDGLLRSMIEASDNESFNELVRMQSEDRSFTEGCKKINAYLKKSPYNETGIYHTLHPSASAQESISKQRNYTSAEDCGMLLERIYEGTCVSREASEEMKNLLLHQRLTEKIPAGVPQGVEVANKTGETDSTQHDAAIVFGPETDYILWVMSSGLTDGDEAVLMVKKISTEVYNYLNK